VTAGLTGGLTAGLTGGLAGGLAGGLLVKVCGMTRAGDARLCAALGADLLGFIFHPASPRRTRPELPASLELPGVRTVGVFVAQTVADTLALMRAGRLDLAQLHGGQDERFCAALADEIGRERVVKVVWPERAASLADFQAELDRFAPYCGLFVVDAGSSGGGHGRTIDAPLLAAARFPRPWLLAGGLRPDNLATMLSQFAPKGLDLNSGVESAPGIKDETKLRAAFTAISTAQTSEVTP